MSIEIQDYRAQSEKYEKKFIKQEKRISTLKAIVGGAFVKTALNYISAPISKKLPLFSQDMTSEKIHEVNHVIDKIAAKESMFGGRSVTIHHIAEEEIKNLNKPESIFDNMSNKLLIKFAQGKNASYYSTFYDNTTRKIMDNVIVINREKLSLASFHELGHAHNYNNSNILRTIQIGKPVWTALAAAVALISAFTQEQKAKDGEKLTFGQKCINFLRNASPVLAFAAMTPQLCEEAIASVKGCNMAKRFLDAETYKQVVKTNTTGYISYLIGAAGMALFALTAKKIKDKSAERQERIHQEFHDTNIHT